MKKLCCLWLTCSVYEQSGPIIEPQGGKKICSWMLLCLHMLPIVNVPMMCIIYLYCRVESESSGREVDAPIIVLFTGISQSVVKNLKQVYMYVYA